MATINKYTLLDEELIVPVALTATDDVTVSLSKKTVIVIDNATGGDLTVNILGNGATTAVCDYVGSVDLSAGKDFTVVDGTTAKIPLNPTYQKWLGDGALTITGGLAATAYVLEV